MTFPEKVPEMPMQSVPLDETLFFFSVGKTDQCKEHPESGAKKRVPRFVAGWQQKCVKEITSAAGGDTAEPDTHSFASERSASVWTGTETNARVVDTSQTAHFYFLVTHFCKSSIGYEANM